MQVVGMMRVKNEARWIERCVSSILPICDRVVVMDDHSSDGTDQICAKLPRVTVLRSPFEGLNEARDKNWLLEQTGRPDWILAIDGDEMLQQGAGVALSVAMVDPRNSCLSLPIFYLWDREDQIRVDGVYGMYRRESAFRPNGSGFKATSNGGSFHCGNVPAPLRMWRRPIDAPLLHYGYLHRADRERKYKFYNEKDPGNRGEDEYRHMVIGDIFPAESKFCHGGPLRLRKL